jgi:hypothetical protein
MLGRRASCRKSVGGKSWKEYWESAELTCSKSQKHRTTRKTCRVQLGCLWVVSYRENAWIRWTACKHKLLCCWLWFQCSWVNSTY